METIIIEFLVGVVAGTISGLLIVKRTRSKTSQRRTLPNVRPHSFRDRRMPRQAKTRQIRSRRSYSKGARTKTISFDTVLEASRLLVGPETIAEPQTTALTCPSCGLQAPETLMLEHFMGSPSHKNGPPKAQPVNANVESAVLTGIPLEDSRDSLRQLLQMLVPPRAFGRRHGQRTIDPLSSFVQTIGPSGQNPAQ